jgi:DMSO/TMAO reductase YedYZ molybdopterin-dependent catalytic subunit
MPLEALRYDVTPAGLHYLLIHFDIPTADAVTHVLSIGGSVGESIQLTIDDLDRLPQRDETVLLECAGNGRNRLSPRPVSVPWVSRLSETRRGLA